MDFTLKITMNNAAFGEDGDPSERADEVARILHKEASRFGSDTPLEPGATGRLYDYNGNTVGSWTVTE